MRSAAAALPLLILLPNSTVMLVRSFSVVARRTSSMAAVTAARPPGFLFASPSSTSSSSSSSSPSPSSSIVDTCRAKIAAALETDDVAVTGAHDDPNGSHISIRVTSALFEGKRPVQRQQLVYKALWEGERAVYRSSRFDRCFCFLLFRFRGFVSLLVS
jgi:stress-induced morphogen